MTINVLRFGMGRLAAKPPTYPSQTKTM